MPGIAVSPSSCVLSPYDPPTPTPVILSGSPVSVPTVQGKHSRFREVKQLARI